MRTKKDFDKQNKYNKTNYDHYNLILPKGKKEELKAIADSRGLSINGFINEAIRYYLENYTEEQ